ncbi:MAG: hypothetical protein JKY57_06520 [Kordiimonadaceae bacterium]|nr:hypothetical protein [Kordiimonadaceae bacterium]
MTLIPQRYKAYKFHIFSDRSKTIFFLEKLAGGEATVPDAKLYPLSDEEKKGLVKIQKQLLSKYGVLAKISKMTVSKGRVYVDLNLTGGNIIDLNSLNIKVEKSKKTEKKALKFLFEGSTSPLAADGSQWQSYDKKAIILETVKRSQYLEMPTATKRYILKTLGLKKSKYPVGSDVTKHAYAAYEAARIYDALTPAKEKLLLQYFGADKDALLGNIVARKLRCRAHYETLKKMSIEIRYRSKELVKAEKEIAGVLLAMGELTEDQYKFYMASLLSFGVAKGVGAAAGKAVKAGSKTAKNSDQAAKIAQDVENFSAYADATTSAGIMNYLSTQTKQLDLLDKTLIVMGTAGIVLGLVFTGGLGAILVTSFEVSTVIIGLVKGRDNYEGEQSELGKALRRAEFKKFEILSAIEDAKESIGNLVKTMQSEDCFLSPADYDFLDDEDESEFRSNLSGFYKRISGTAEAN